MKDIEPALAKALGFPKPEYVAIERERRWLCAEDFPRDLIRETLTIKDLYVDDTRMRLREMRPHDGTPPIFKLSRKADVDARTRLITTIYLPEQEFNVLAAMLKGLHIVKTRHRLHAPDGVRMMSVDEFESALAGLKLIEAEFETDEAARAFATPAFTIREVTEDSRYTGAVLARRGHPR